MASLKETLFTAVAKMVGDPADVTAVEDLSPHFRLLKVTQTGAAPKAGFKVQVMTSDGPRTYSPFGIEGSGERYQLLVYRHDATSAAGKWIAGVKRGDQLLVFGPRKSTDLEGATGMLALFGDETSFAVAKSAVERGKTTPKQLVFEVTDAAESKTVLEKLGLSEALVFERKADQSHLNDVTTAFEKLGAPLVLTGAAKSIQQVRSQLRAHGIGTAQISKGYWAPGKKGID